VPKVSFYSLCGEEAKEKLVLEKLTSQWLTHCVVIYQPRAESLQKILRASCWMHVHHGQCCHPYAAEQLEKIKIHVPEQMPWANQAAEMLRDGEQLQYDDAAFRGSSEEADV